MCSFISSLIGAVIGGWLGVYFYKQKERSKINVEFSKKLDIELVELCGECLIVIEEDKRIWEFSDPYERVYPITSHKEINKLYKFLLKYSARYSKIEPISSFMKKYEHYLDDCENAYMFPEEFYEGLNREIPSLVEKISSVFIERLEDK